LLEEDADLPLDKDAENALIIMKRSLKYQVARFFDPREFISFTSHYLTKKKSMSINFS